MKRLELQELGTLSSEKLRQREGALSRSGVEGLLEELRHDIKRLRRYTDDDKPLEAKEGGEEPVAMKPNLERLGVEAELAKQAEYEFELKERATILRKL
jgi:hypothetical protein